MAMMLSVELLQSEESHSQWIQRVMRNLLNKGEEIYQGVFNFVMIVWQRWPNLIDHELISVMTEKKHFIVRLTESKKSIYMAFFMLLSYFLEPSQKNKGIVFQAIQALSLKVKE
jgi:hypothetical protein